MISETVKNNKAYQYALWCVDEDNKKAGKYVKKQCQEFLDCLNDENSKYYIDENELKVIEGFLRLINIKNTRLTMNTITKSFSKYSKGSFLPKISIR